MPEGDTIAKLARALERGLVGHPVESARVPELPDLDLEGRAIEGVRAAGKHLWIDFSGRSASAAGSLRSHLGMHGSWHRYDVGEPWNEPRRRPSLVLVVDGSEWVLFAAAELEWQRGAAARDETVGGRLGLDLTRGSAEPRELWQRANFLCGDRALVMDVLLEQRVASGLGNVYKSELLFLFGLGVRTRLGELHAERLAEIYAKGSELLGRNLGSGARTTRFVDDGRGSVWVYGRGGAPCLRCGAAVQRAALGRHRRSTYWCPSCQPNS